MRIYITRTCCWHGVFHCTPVASVSDLHNNSINQTSQVKKTSPNPFPLFFSIDFNNPSPFNQISIILSYQGRVNPFQIDKFHCPKQKVFRDDNSKFDGNCRKLCKRVENIISPFPIVFLKDLHCRRVKTWWGLFGKGLTLFFTQS